MCVGGRGGGGLRQRSRHKVSVLGVYGDVEEGGLGASLTPFRVVLGT